MSWRKKLSALNDKLYELHLELERISARQPQTYSSTSRPEPVIYYSQPYQPYYTDRFHPGQTLAQTLYPGVIDPSGLYMYSHGIGSYGNQGYNGVGF